jgi:GNAT superfamily N-acetyltransferase
MHARASRSGHFVGELLVKDQMVIRTLVRTDFPEWKVLWDGYNAFYGRVGETALSDDITGMTGSRFFDAYEPMHAVVAETSGNLIGLAHVLLHRSTIQIAPTVYLQDVFTVGHARGRGAGRALIEAVYEYAAVVGSPRVYWHTHETNSVARQLYDKVAERSGFIVYGKTVPERR